MQMPSCISLVISTFVGLFISTALRAQGALTVNPISGYTAEKQGVLKVTIQNLTDKKIRFEIVRDCDIDGSEYSGKECDNFFKISTDAPEKNKNFELESHARASLTVSLAKNINSYALFKPLIRALFDDGLPKNGIGFEFNHRPGMLFLIKPGSDKLTDVTFSTTTSQTARVATFNFDVKKFSSPRVTNVSAKLLNASSKKLLRFARLAEEKIVDPRREILKLEVEYGRLEDPAETLCYELYIQDKSTQGGLDKLTNCQP